MKYVNETCPVCGKEFTDESDVVVCPDCGTPHHRDCYFEIGHCQNQDKHSSDFAWVASTKPAVEELQKKEEDKDKAKAPIPIPIPVTRTSNNIPENGIIGEMSVDKDGRQHPVYREIRGNEKIGKATVKEYADVVQKNVYKFIPKFIIMDRTGSKVSWNWAAFFFGPYWLAYRKMWKQAILAVVIISIIPLMFINEITTYYKEAAQVTSELLMSESLDTEEKIAAAQEEYQKKMPQQPRALTVASYMEMAVNIVCALYGNYLYKTKCESLMAKAKTKSDNVEVQQAYIHKKGGRSLLGAVAFIVIMYALLSVALAVGMYAKTDLATVLRRYIK